MKSLILILSVLALSATAFQSRFLAQDTPLVPLKNVSMAILFGDWFELERLGFDFEADTACSKVRLAFPENNAWEVTVTARNGSATGNTVQTTGTITAQGSVKNYFAAEHFPCDTSQKETKLEQGKDEGKFNAQFGQGAITEFYVFAEPTYFTWVLFGSPDRKNFWLLSRKSGMDDNLLGVIENIAEENGFDYSSFVHVDQGPQCSNKIRR